MHQDAIADGNAERAAAAAFAVHEHDHRHFEHRHLAQVDRNRFGDAALLGLDAGIRRRRVDEADDRAPELLRHLHRPHRLAIAVRPRVTEVAIDLLLGVAALLVADDEDRLALVERGAGDDRVIVGETAIAVQLDEVGEQALDVVERGRARRMARHLDALPRRQVAIEVAAHRR